jgi:hypothetical protein
MVGWRETAQALVAVALIGVPLAGRGFGSFGRPDGDIFLGDGSVEADSLARTTT